MIKITSTIAQLITDMRRPGAPVPTWLLDSTVGSKLGDALRLTAERLYDQITTYAELAGQLPALLWPAEKKALVSRSYYEGQEQVLRRLASAQRRSSDVLPGTLVAPEQLERWAAEMEGYAGLSQAAEVGLNLLLDLGLLQEGFGWFVVREVTAEVLRRIEDPAVPVAEKDRLREAFEDVLRYRDLLAKVRTDSKDALAGQKEEGDEALQEAQMEELFMQVQYGVQHGQMFDEGTLEKTARWWHKRKQKQAAKAAEDRKQRR